MEKEKTYIFTKEIKKWGVEAGDYYNPDRHMVVGGTEKLLADGVIEEEEDDMPHLEPAEHNAESTHYWCGFHAKSGGRQWNGKLNLCCGCFPLRECSKSQETEQNWEDRFDKQFAMACAQVAPELEMDIKAFIAKEIEVALIEEREKFIGLIPKKKQDANLEPGFNVITEFRLGELRGHNQVIDDFTEALNKKYE